MAHPAPSENLDEAEEDKRLQLQSREQNARAERNRKAEGELNAIKSRRLPRLR